MAMVIMETKKLTHRQTGRVSEPKTHGYFLLSTLKLTTMALVAMVTRVTRVQTPPGSALGSHWTSQLRPVGKSECERNPAYGWEKKEG